MSELVIDDLSVQYRTEDELIKAVTDVSLSIAPGEIVGVIGESGSGKSTVGKSIVKVLDANGAIAGGSISYDGTDLTELSDTELSELIRGKKIGSVFQDPHASLNPVRTIGSQITELVGQHHDVDSREAKERTITLLGEMGISSAAERYDAYPSSFSGGMLQRVVLAMAIAGDPDLLIADEPTTGLDMTVQAQVLHKFKRLNKAKNMGIMYITHDLDLLPSICDRVVVMYQGQVVETGTCDAVFDDPKHPYTAKLLESRIQGEITSGRAGDPSPDPGSSGCPYHTICPEAIDGECDTGSVPPVYETEDRQVRCYLYDESQMEGIIDDAS